MRRIGLYVVCLWGMLGHVGVADQLAALHNDGRIRLYNTHLGETVDVRYRSTDGRYDDGAIEEIRHILRCRLTHEAAPIPIELIELVDHIEDHFHAREVAVISGYRSPALNTQLRSAGRGVAKNSRHMRGEAIDIRLPGISTQQLYRYAWSLRQGGVGYYPKTGFVHVDVGPVRTW